jgi:polyisoprenoid-binding protein YceI
MSALAEGSWQVDPGRSELSFQARGTFGLVPVRGSFHDYSGQMTVADGSPHGELTIKAASLDTHNAMRDKHLRSADFFDVEEHETLTFRLLGLTDEPAGTTLRGILRIKGTELEVTAPLQVETQGEEVSLSTELEVDRAAAGIGWSRAGMIKGPAKLSARLTLVRG